MPSKTTDPGRQILTEITKWAKAHSTPIVNGHVPIHSVASIQVNLDADSNEGTELCALMDRVSPYLIVSELSELTAEDLDESIDKLLSRGVDADEIAITRACSKYVGHAASLTIHLFIKGGPLALAHTYFAPWGEDAFREDLNDEPPPLRSPEDIARLRAENEEREKRYRAAQEERDRWTPAVRTEAARRIASDQRFPQAKTEAARVFITRSVLAGDVPGDDYLVKEISREAKAIFDFEIGPKK